VVAWSCYGSVSEPARASFLALYVPQMVVPKVTQVPNRVPLEPVPQMPAPSVPQVPVPSMPQVPQGPTMQTMPVVQEGREVSEISYVSEKYAAVQSSLAFLGGFAAGAALVYSLVKKTDQRMSVQAKEFELSSQTSSRPRSAAVRMAEDGEEPDPLVAINEAEAKFKKTLDSVSESLATLRVGRANPSLLDRVEVSYYDTPTPLNQVASITAPTASQLVVDPFDKNAIVLGNIEKALLESDIGMTPNSDGKIIRLNVPAMTEERRKELAKTAKSLGEDGKVALRNVRKSCLDKIKKLEKLGKDEIKNCEEDVTTLTKKYEGDVEALVAKRDKEIMTV